MKLISKKIKNKINLRPLELSSGSNVFLFVLGKKKKENHHQFGGKFVIL